MESLDLKSGKIVDKILSFPDFVADYRHWYGNQTFRYGYLVGNGRVYQWLDEDDVTEMCTKLELTARQTIGVREEFDNDRLHSIWDHCCDSESDYYTDWLGGCAHDDYRERARLYGRYLRLQEESCTVCELESEGRDHLGRVRYYSRIEWNYKKFEEFRAKGMSQQDVMKFYENEYGEEIKQLDYLKTLQLSSKDAFGGKYPTIAEEGTASVHEDDDILTLVERIESAADELTNKKFYDELLGRNDRWQTWDSVKEVLNLINDCEERMNEMRDAVEFVHEYINGVTKNFKEILLDRLEQEIGEFVADELSIEERVQEGLAKVNTFVVVDSEEVVTDLHAHAPTSRVKEVIELFKQGNNVEGLVIGSYKISKVFEVDGETYFKIGCHLFKLSEVEQKLAA
jgi:hypothetical protein